MTVTVSDRFPNVFEKLLFSAAKCDMRTHVPTDAVGGQFSLCVHRVRRENSLGQSRPKAAIPAMAGQWVAHWILERHGRLK